ncbi:MAG: thioredoxin family protein [Deltaproteobacteria bacterium]|nr:MAG: thioredoxin family protein [Deltaproteobacteria bacterium]
MRSKYVFHALFILFCLFAWLPNGALAAEGIKWYTYDEGMALGKNEKKTVFFYFYADWCPYCRKMEKETFQNPSVVSFINENFIAIRVNADKEKKIASNYGVIGLPTSWFLEGNGDKIGNLPGYIPPERFLSMLKKILAAPKKGDI